MTIDSRKIIEVASSMPIRSNERGIMGAFGIYALINYNEFYYKLVSRITKEMDDTRALIVDQGLYDAVLECGYHTFHGVRNSMHWREHVLPMIRSAEDEIEALIAFTNTFGIGFLEIDELVPKKKLVTIVKNAYDPGRYLEEYGPQKRGRCYLFSAITAAYMDLVYGSPYPQGMGTFIAKEVECRAMGHDLCKFIARREPML